VDLLIPKIDLFLCRASVCILSEFSVPRNQRIEQLPVPPKVVKKSEKPAIKIGLTVPTIVLDVALGVPRDEMIRVEAILSDVHIGQGEGNIPWRLGFGPLNVNLHSAHDPMTILTSTQGAFRIFERELEDNTPPTPAEMSEKSEDENPIVGWTKIEDQKQTIQPRGKKNVLEQFRNASSKFLQSGRGKRTGKIRANKLGVPGLPPTVPEKRRKEESDVCETEMELHVPRVNFKLNAEALLDLQEGIQMFVLPYGEAARAAAATPSVPSTPPKAAFMISVDSLWYEIVERDIVDDPLFLHISKLRCRYVGMVGKLGLLGKDVRVLRARTLEEVVHPWYAALRSPTDVSDGDVPLNFPMEKPGAHTPPFDLFTSIDDDTWQQNDCLLYRMDSKVRTGATHCHIGLDVNGLLWRQNADLVKVYSRIWDYLNLPVAPPPETVETKARDRTTFSVYRIGLKSCLFDIPGAWFPEDEEGDFASKTKGIIHLDDLEISMGSLYGQLTQGVKITTEAVNGFIIDNVNHLSTQILNCASHAAPPVYLSSLGYAHVARLKGFKMIWKGKTASKEGDHNKNTFNVSLEDLGIHLCSDTVQCIVNLVLAVPNAEEADRLIPDSVKKLKKSPQPSEPDFDFDENETPQVPEIELTPQGQFAQRLTFSSAVERPSGSSVGEMLIEDYIATQEQFTSPAVSVNPLHGNEQIGGASSSSHIPTSFNLGTGGILAAMETSFDVDSSNESMSQDLTKPQSLLPPEKDFDFEEDSDVPSFAPRISEAIGEPIELQEKRTLERDKSKTSIGSDINVCLLDPEAYTSEKLAKLADQEQEARQEINDMFPQEKPVRETVHAQAGTTTKWFVEPKDVAIVNDHLVSWDATNNDNTDESPRLTAARVKKSKEKFDAPLLMSAQVKVSGISVCIYAGTDFRDDAYARYEALVAEGSKPKVNRLNRRQKNQSLELKLDGAILNGMIYGAEQDIDGSEIYRKRFSMLMKNFALLDRIQSSVFQHVICYWDDDANRPRSAQNNMIQLFVDEVTRTSPQAVKEVGSLDGTRVSANLSEVKEYRMDLRILPLQITLDQDMIEFCINFIQILRLPTYIEIEATLESDESPVTPNSPGSMGAGDEFTEIKQKPKKEVKEDEPALDFMGGIFFSSISISPLLLSVDYRAKRLDLNALRRGEAWQLCNLLPLLEGLEVCFRRAHLKRVSGFDQLGQQLFNIWKKDIDRAQILRTIMGITPIRSLTNIGMSMGNLIREPLQQYFQTTGQQRVSRGMLRVLTSGLRNITVETISLTETCVVAFQNILEYAEAQIANPQNNNTAVRGRTNRSSIPVRRSREPTDNVVNPAPGEGNNTITDNWTVLDGGAQEFVVQPKTAQEGVMYGLHSFQRSLKTASKSIATPIIEYRRGETVGNVVSSTVRGVPVMILRPAIGASGFAATTLRGVKNHVDSNRRQEALNKYKGPRLDDVDEDHF